MINHYLLKKWFQDQSRDLPWRKTIDPYAIWISEVMLQQTQVNVVIPYFLNWMNQFPSIHELAQASLDQVIKAWEGLGYYSRARHIHEGARYVVENFNGILPDNEQELKKIKGLGPYTIGAILSFAFHQKIPAVDGNVMRVISRLFAIQEDITKSSTQKKIRQITLEMLPDKDPWVIMEALIELGATVCQRKPKCQSCPIMENCIGFQKGLTDDLPVKLKKQQITHLHRLVFILQHESYFLVKRGERGKVMSDLYEFPYLEVNSFDENHTGHLNQFLIDHGLECVLHKKLEKVKHSFTRFQVQLYPSHFHSLKKNDVMGYEWINFKELLQLAFSSGHRRILNDLKLDCI